MDKKYRAGRKPKYESDFPARVEKMAREGMIEADMARKLGISVSTFENYKNEKLEFLEALKKGKKIPDQNVESALYRKAVGHFELVEVKTETLETRAVGAAEGEAPLSVEVVRVTRTKREVPPDTTAQIFWLKNRRPDIWRDKHEYQLNLRAEVEKKYADYSELELREAAREALLKFKAPKQIDGPEKKNDDVEVKIDR
jgi:hypothetical protein